MPWTDADAFIEDRDDKRNARTSRKPIPAETVQASLTVLDHQHPELPFDEETGEAA